MEKYKCEICGRNHDYYGSYPMLSMPSIIEKMSDLEKEKLTKLHDFFYHLEGSFFLIKGDLFVKVKNQDWFIHWEVWAKIEEDDFCSLPDDLDTSSIYRIKAVLISPILHYDVSLNMPIYLIFHFEDKNSYPEVEFIDEFSEIGHDFFYGISIDKLNGWMESIYHPELIKNDNQNNPV